MTEEQILIKLKEVMTSLSIDYMPTVQNLRQLGLNEIERDIYALGGQKKFAMKHGIPMKRSTQAWTESLIKEKIIFTMQQLKINTFPTANQFEEVLGDKGLSVKIGRAGGFRAWAEKLNIPLKESDTLFGNIEEDFVKDLLEDKGYVVKNMTTNHKYDLLINEYIRVDVKASHIFHGINGDYFSFNLEGKYHDCDIFVLITINDKEEKSVYIIPSKYLMGQKQVSMGTQKSKWNNFKDRYDFIDKYISFYENL